jgi:hypothetical protein
MYGLNGSYWFDGSHVPLPYGSTHDYYNIVPLGGYAAILPIGMTSLPWQTTGGTGD